MSETPPPIPPPKPPFVPPPAAPGMDPAMRFALPVHTSGWAIAAGYLGLFSLMLLPAPLSLVTSIVALKKVAASKKTEKPLYGNARAIFGLVMGILGTLALAAILLNAANG